MPPPLRWKLDHMTELDLRQSPWNEGLGLSSEYLNQQLYLLGCMVHASAVLDSLPDHALLNLRTQFQEIQIGQVLLGVAVAIRNAMDQNPARAQYWLDGIDANVGTLYPTAQESTQLSLTVREACNKIIHCDSINFHYVADQPRRGLALEPKVHLYGTHNGKDWKATIDVDRFIHVCAQLTG
jgi:hypothetical protein